MTTKVDELSRNEKKSPKKTENSKKTKPRVQNAHLYITDKRYVKQFIDY